MIDTNLKFKHDYDEEDGHILELSIRCRLGAAPTIVRQLLESSIEPLARRYDPNWTPQELPMQPSDNPNDEPSRFPFVNQDDPNKPGVGDLF